MRKLSATGLLVTSLLAAGLFITSPATASASATCPPIGSAFASDAGATAGLKDCPPKGSTPTPTAAKGERSSQSVKPACVWVPKPDYQPGVGQKTEGDGGHWYTKFCSFGEYQTLADFEDEMASWDPMNMRQTELLRRSGLETRFFVTPPSEPRRTPDQVMASVVDTLPFPKTFIAVNPVATKQVVGVPTWVWLTEENGKFVPERYEQKTKTIELEGYQLRWQIVPELTVSPGGAGQERSCEGPGVPWSASAEGDPGACTVNYEKSGQYTLSASVGWTVQWWLENERQEDIDGPTNTATQAVTVLEVQTLTR